MGLLTMPFKLPLMPVRGVINLAETVGDEAERQLHDPARVRRVLEDANRRWEAGEITDEELSEIENTVVGSLVRDPSPAAEADEDGS